MSDTSNQEAFDVEVFVLATRKLDRPDFRRALLNYCHKAKPIAACERDNRIPTRRMLDEIHEAAQELGMMHLFTPDEVDEIFTHAEDFIRYLTTSLEAPAA